MGDTVLLIGLCIQQIGHLIAQFGDWIQTFVDGRREAERF